jgi:alpha-tubulin suppressor-like RCC1 family protein
MAASGDVDGDGINDIVWENDSTGARVAWIMNGTAGVVSAPQITTEVTAWRIVGLLIPQVTRTYSSVATGAYHTCGISTGGAAYCWGFNNDGQLGDADTAQRVNATPVQGNVAFASLVAGYAFTCGLTAGGSPYCWGSNSNGQLGDGSTTNHGAPNQLPNGVTFTSLAAGFFHTCGLTSAGAAYCWGANANGQLGDSTTVQRPTPVPVQGGLTFTSLTAGALHTCGLATSGAAYCWGDNTDGQLGDSTLDQSIVPVAVVGGHVFKTITAGLSAGFDRTCGLTTDGAAYCWGDNTYGQLGTGDSTQRIAPTPVQGGLVFASLSAGAVETCGLTSGGTAYCWGDNSTNGGGELGDGTTTDRVTPTAVAGGLSFTMLSGGFYHTCGLISSGLAYCWGYNATGELGDGTIANHAVPTIVIP